jgi:hypothetical protein
MPRSRAAEHVFVTPRFRGYLKDAKQPERDHAAELIAIAEASRGTLLRPTVPIYQGERHGVPEVAGSGVLVTLADMRFLLTAGHVLDLTTKGQLVVGVSPEVLALAGDPMRLQTPGSAQGLTDRIDIGVVHLDRGPWTELSLDRFVGPEQLDTQIPIVARHSYALIGYPTSMNRKGLAGGQLTAVAISIGGLECPSDFYAHTSTDPEANVMVGLDRESLWTAYGQRTGPDLYGSSGCGLWRYGRYIRTSLGPPKLSAIGIEWHRKGRHRHVLGTRVPLVLAAIADKYAEIREFLDEHQLASRTSGVEPDGRG